MRGNVCDIQQQAVTISLPLWPFRTRCLTALFVLSLLMSGTLTAEATSAEATEDAAIKSPAWTTSLNLYLTAKEAHSLLATDNTAILIDVRPRPAYFYLGHPEGAYSVAARFWTGRLNPETGKFIFRNNKRFAESVGSFVTKKDATIVILGSTGKSGAVAVEKLAEAGYTNVYNIKLGFAGWLKSELPTTRNIDMTRIYIRKTDKAD